MRPLVSKLKPARGFSQLAHLGLLILLPAVVYVFVRLGSGFVQLAFSIILLSKWRMFAVRPRFWPAIVRANSVDILVGLSIVVFMIHSDGSMLWQIAWALLYAAWLIYVKPATSTVMVAVQAMVGQLAGLMAVFMSIGSAPLYVLVIVSASICYLAARHFFDNFDEAYAKLLAYLWGAFAAGLVWLLGHWLLFYGVVAQPTLLLTVLGYGLAGVYYFDHAGKLNALMRRQFMFVMLAVVLAVLIFSNWGDKVV